jgi:hypothetical protein
MKSGVQTSHDVVWCAKAKKGWKKNVSSRAKMWSRRWPQGESQKTRIRWKYLPIHRKCLWLVWVLVILQLIHLKTQKGNWPTSKEISKVSTFNHRTFFFCPSYKILKWKWNLISIFHHASLLSEQTMMEINFICCWTVKSHFY